MNKTANKNRANPTNKLTAKRVRGVVVRTGAKAGCKW